jgi:hypothetical protein
VDVRHALGVVLGALTLALAAPGAHADVPPKRPVPEYAGRPPPPPTPGEIALWVPRVVFSPVYFTTEYLIRRPLGAAITAAERAGVPSALYDFFAFGPDHKAGIAPTVFVDFGFNPSVGVYAFWDDAIFRGDDLRLHVSTWGSDWIAGSFVQRIHFWDRDSLALRVGVIRRPDYVFYGLGPRTLQADQSRYAADRLDASATADFPLWRSSRVTTGVGVRSVSFQPGHFGDDPSVPQQVAAGVYATPPGFDRGYLAEYDRVLVALDSRRPYPDPGTGVRLEAQAEMGNDFGSTPAAGWIRYEAMAGGFLDVDGHRRIVSLAATAAFADPLGVRPVPFTELATLGGDGPMPGFYPGRLVDRSAAAAVLRYRWPIAPFVDGSLQASVGNVFGPHLGDFDPALLRLSGAVGIESDGSPDSNFQLLLGIGTETFAHGAQVDSVRLAVGTSRGF